MLDFKVSDLSKLFLFESIAESDLEALAQTIAFDVRSYQRDELIYRPDSYQRSIGFILRGGCRVNKKRHDGTLIPLNDLVECDSFGAITLFSDTTDFPTYIYATKQTTVLFINKSDAVSLIERNPQISLNFIKFLTGKILFLNTKIATFSSGSAEQKLANYLLTLRAEKQACEFSFNKKLASEALGIGRASLYRSLEALEEKQLIKTDNKKIYIIDPTGLERITK